MAARGSAARMMLGSPDTGMYDIVTFDLGSDT
jgi:hypothetical protein